jgi:hypothetical protein
MDNLTLVFDVSFPYISVHPVQPEDLAEPPGPLPALQSGQSGGTQGKLIYNPKNGYCLSFLPFDFFSAKNMILRVFLCRWVGRFRVPAYSKYEFSVQRIFVGSMYTVLYR